MRIQHPENMMLEGKPAPQTCPKCGEPFTPFLRGLTHRYPWKWGWIGCLLSWTRPYCALVCTNCKANIGWEDPFEGREETTCTGCKGTGKANLELPPGVYGVPEVFVWPPCAWCDGTGRLLRQA